MASKVTTGLVGLAVEARPHEKLKILYTNTLKALSVMPKTGGYRKYTEEVTNQRLNSVNTITDLNELEKSLGAGQLEEVIDQAKNELKLARRMNQWKPWEPLVNQPPEGQWDWP